MRLRTAWFLGLSFVAVSACNQTIQSGDPLAPPAVAEDQQGVDSLLVGHNFMLGGEYELALKAYQRAVIDRGLTPDVLNGLAIANMRLGRTGEAEQLLRAAVEQDRDYGPGWNNLGVLLAETGNYREAKRAFEIAFSLGGGRSSQIKTNIAKTVAKIENIDYTEPENNNDFELVQQGNGVFLLLQTPS
ncbi:MAG: tetratricopeptide repeat protein [Pseudomonadota bacterium]